MHTATSLRPTFLFALFVGLCSFVFDKCPSDYEPDMVLIPEGDFQMGSEAGSDDEKPVRTVHVHKFYMATTEVTVAEFRAFVNDSDYKTDAERVGDSSWIFSNKEVKYVKGVNWRYDAEGNQRPASEDSHPVVHVSWNDAQAYCDWLSRKSKKKYRLPSEAEWEYAAANGKDHTKYSWGNQPPYGDPTSPPDKKVGGNVADESFKAKAPAGWEFFDGYNDGYALDAPVAQFAPNKFGLYDMTGNVWEWCRDCWHPSYAGAPSDSRPWEAGECKFRVLRGGSWINYPYYCRSAIRVNYAPAFRYYVIGFRLARDAD